MGVYILDVCQHCGKTTRHAVAESGHPERLRPRTICTACGGVDCQGVPAMHADYWRGLLAGILIGAVAAAIACNILRDLFYTS